MAYVAPKVTVTGSGGSIFAGSVATATNISSPCTSLPANAIYYNGLTTYSPSALSGSLTASYSFPATQNTCQYTCASGYGWNGSTCVAATAYSSATTYSTGQAFTWSGANVSVIGTGIGISNTTTPGCNTADTVVWQASTNNVQIWATCNAGATTAFLTGTVTYPSNTIPTGAQETWMGAYYQWGNNADLTSAPTSATLLSAPLASYGYPQSAFNSSANYILTTGNGDWNSSSNDNLWGNTTNTSIARQ